MIRHDIPHGDGGGCPALELCPIAWRRVLMVGPRWLDWSLGDVGGVVERVKATAWRDRQGRSRGAVRRAIVVC